METTYNPQTDRGTGLALPISKATNHVMSVHTAITRAWPLTIEEAIAELTEAQNHLQDTQFPEGLVSEDTAQQYVNYNTLLRDSIRNLENTLSHLETPEAQVTADYISNLQDIVQRSWIFLCSLDYELAGLSGVQNDPGRLP